VSSKKNPQSIDSQTNLPFCFADYDEDDRICMEDCNYGAECANEAEIEKEYRNLAVEIDGRPICFGKHYSANGPSCQNHCRMANNCERTTEMEINSSLDKPDYATRTLPPISSTGIRSGGLNVIGNVYQSPPSYNYSSTQFSSLGSTTVRPAPPLTNQQALELYGVPLDPHPMLPGQFLGESVFSRFAKLFVLNTGESAIRVFTEIFIHLIRQIHWAPAPRRFN